MPKKAYIASHLSIEELKQKYKSSVEPVEARRWHLLWHIAKGWTIRNSAIAVGINYEYAQKILKRYNEQGEEGIKNQRRQQSHRGGGKKALLNPEQIQELKAAIAEKPSDGGIWTGPKVARWIETKTGIAKVWEQRGWEYLKKCGYSWQRPRPKHRKGDPVEQAKFKAELPQKVQHIEAKHPTATVEVWFFDEHRVGLKPILRKVWHPVGQRPIAVVQHRYEWLYVYGFVEPKTGKTHWYLIPRVDTQWLSLVYKAFAEDVGASSPAKVILLIEDRAGWHCSEKVHIPDGIEVDYLPPYSPELQPAERLWLLLDEPLVNQHFDSIAQIEEVLSLRCNTLTTMTQEVRDLTNYHWLNYS